MNTDDSLLYWLPALVQLKLGGDYEGQSHALDELLGVTEYRDYYRRIVALDTPMSEDLKTLLTQIIGPHGKTILKAYRIKKGLE